MRALLRDVDRLLRGSFTRKEDLAAGRIPVPVRTLTVAGVLLGGLYGAFMGLFGGLRPVDPSWLQVAATTVKVPLLFLLTLAVTFPSLYVFSALSRSPLRGADTLRLLLAAIGVNLAVLASFGPVTGFFTLSTESYPFMVVLNVLLFTVAGLIGLGFLRRALRVLFEAAGEDEGPSVSSRVAAGVARAFTAAPPPPPPPQPGPEGGGGLPPIPRSRSGRPRALMSAWCVVFAVVGAQMGWILRPFIGSPDLPFELFRQRESSFFAAFFQALGALFQ